MSQDLHPGNSEKPLILLERLTGIVLLLVIASLGWMLVVVHLPEWGQWATPQIQVIVILALLTAALLLVSVLALLHTRG